ncbi:MAG: hypothetical protein CMA63_06730 [Euryarchaeota archaeon]|nr:hypothetical protein [Euryarchaeota archaeon]
MEYRARREMTFSLNGRTNQQTKINPGTTLEAVQLSEVDPVERKNLEKMQQREQKSDSRVRLLFFRWQGVVRSAHAGRDLEVVTKRRSIPTEKSKSRRLRRDRTKWGDRK